MSAAGTGLLVGYGSIGRRHLANLHALGVEDWAVVHTGAGTLPLEPPTAVRTYPTLAAALEAEQPTFAVVANPTAMHVDTARVCADAGCRALLLEKPISHSVDGLAALVETVEAAGTAVLVGFQFRFEASLRRVGALLRDGTLGEPLHARATWGEYLPNWHPWEDWRTGYAARPELGGGVHHTISHPHDYLRMLFDEPLEVSAWLSDAHPLGLPVAEAVDVHLRYARGLAVDLHLDYWARPPVHRIEVTTTAGSLVWDYTEGRLAVWTADDPEWRTEEIAGLAGRDELFVHEAAHFLRVVDGAEAPACTLTDGIAALHMADAIERSSAAGGATLAPGPAP